MNAGSQVNKSLSNILQKYFFFIAKSKRPHPYPGAYIIKILQTRKIQSQAYITESTQRQIQLWYMVFDING